MDYSQVASEDKIRKAMEKGEFDNLPGYGKPLQLEDLSSIPEDLRMAYKVMKNAGMLEESEIKRELLKIEDLLETCEDEEQRKQLQQKKNEKQFRLAKLMKQRNSSNSSVFKNYQARMNDKFK